MGTKVLEIYRHCTHRAVIQRLPASTRAVGLSMAGICELRERTLWAMSAVATIAAAPAAAIQESRRLGRLRGKASGSAAKAAALSFEKTARAKRNSAQTGWFR